MPIYEYQCRDCGKTLELLLDMDDTGSKTCGFRCPLERGEQDDIRGFGTLRRLLSAFNQVSERARIESPTSSDAAKVGLSTYKNEGDGTFKKIAGREGPDILRR